MWHGKDFLPHISQSHPPLFLINPPILVVVTATINTKMILFTITINYYLCSITIRNKTEPNAQYSPWLDLPS